MQMELEKLDVQIFADGADIDGIKALRKNRLIKGFTTNPTLMKQAGISDYLAFSREVLEIIDGLPISLEVFSDDLDEMKRQAIKLGALGENVYVKIPITNTQRISTKHNCDFYGRTIGLRITGTFERTKVLCIDICRKNCRHRN
jgi:hypothetical protein